MTSLLKRLRTTILLISFMFGANAQAKVSVLDQEDMLLSSDLVALVDIVELNAAEPGTAYSDLNVRARLTQVLKGVTMKTDLEFKIPRNFPCAAFDVSTGMHLVFLKKDKDGKWTGTNWFMSYVYLGGKKARWYDENGIHVESGAPEELIKRVKERIEKAEADEAADQQGKGSAGSLYQLRKPTI